MKVELIPFQARHARGLKVQELAICANVTTASDEYLHALEALDSWSVTIDGEVKGCAGVVPVWHGFGQCWAVISQDIGCFGLLGFTRVVARYLRASQVRRLETTVSANFEPGHRWMRTLGFRQETPHPMRHYFPDGSDAILYSLVRE